eukprot:SAG11_NODE_24157_length_377_cov_0.924460_2_plen_52_part_00
MGNVAKPSKETHSFAQGTMPHLDVGALLLLLLLTLPQRLCLKLLDLRTNHA